MTAPAPIMPDRVARELMRTGLHFGVDRKLPRGYIHIGAAGAEPTFTGSWVRLDIELANGTWRWDSEDCVEFNLADLEIVHAAIGKVPA